MSNNTEIHDYAPPYPKYSLEQMLEIALSTSKPVSITQTITNEIADAKESGTITVTLKHQ